MAEPLRRSGYAVLLGRPNVGKSTLLNRLLGRVISITSPKPQTTRHAILGIRTLADVQIVFVDTPGLHVNINSALNRYMNRVACSTLNYVDVAVFMIEALRWTEEDVRVLDRLAVFEGPVILAVNKVDQLAEKARLLPFLKEQAGRREYAGVLPISAVSGDNVAMLERSIAGLLPESDFLFPEDQITTVGQRFMAAELVREKLTRRLRQELPYALTVEIETFQEDHELLRIGAIIWVGRQGHKRIVIGKNGATLKEIGRQARQDMEILFDRRVFLETWVKVKEGWSDDDRSLRYFGYQDQPHE